jgi:hypothetical protein
MLSGGSSNAAVNARHLVEKHFLDPRLSDTAGTSYVGRFYSLTAAPSVFRILTAT